MAKDKLHTPVSDEEVLSWLDSGVKIPVDESDESIPLEEILNSQKTEEGSCKYNPDATCQGNNQYKCQTKSEQALDCQYIKFVKSK